MLYSGVSSDVKKFQPTYKLLMVSCHEGLMKVASTIAYPFFAIADYCNQTSVFKNYLNKK